VRNQIVLEDNMLGVIDNDITHEHVDVEVAEITYVKTNQQGGNKDFVYY
jgi:hypothetical protein